MEIRWEQKIQSTSWVMDKEGQGVLRQLHSINHEVTENVQTIEDVRETFWSCTHSITDKWSKNEIVLKNRSIPEHLTKQDVAGPESRDERVGFSLRVEMLQDKRVVEKDSEHFSISNTDKVSE
jgi:hypothetical protein